MALSSVAAALRLYQLGEVPPGFQFDEAFNAIDAQQVLAGNRPLFLPANDGREALYTYWQALLAGILGLDFYTLRLASALAGIATIPAFYAVVRRLLINQSRLIALFSTLSLTLSFWHIHFSHFGIRVILMPLIFCGVFGLAWLGYHADTRRRRLLALIGAGVCAGLSVWAHPTGRLTPVVLIGFAAWLYWYEPQRRIVAWDSPLGGLLVMGTTAFLVFLPLGFEFFRHPEFFFNHPVGVFILNPEVGDEAPLQLLLSNILNVLGMFSIEGDRDWFYNFSGRPAFDPWMSLAFYLGILIALIRLRASIQLRTRGGMTSGDDAPGAQRQQVDELRTSPVWRAVSHPQDTNALVLFGLWAVVMLIPTVLSESAPNFSRALPALPAFAFVCGLGLATLAQLKVRRLPNRVAHMPQQTYRVAHMPRQMFGMALAALIVGYSGARANYDYFARFAAHDSVYYAFDQDKIDALVYLGQLTDDYRVYLSPLWGDAHATVRYLRGPMGISSLDTTHTIVLPPPGYGAVYAFPNEQTDRATALAAQWEDVDVRTAWDRLDRPLLSYVQIDADTAAHWPNQLAPTQEQDVPFVDGPRLVGMRANTPDHQLYLYWRAEARMWRDLTAFVHLIDQDGRRVGQIDKLPGNGSYRTPDWLVGERVIDRFIPTRLDRCAGGDLVRVQTGWYAIEHTTANPVLREDMPSPIAQAGLLQYTPALNLPGELSPPTSLAASFHEGLTLTGFAVRADEVEANAPLVVDLYWWTAQQGNEPETRALPLELALVRESDGSRHAIWRDVLTTEIEFPGEYEFCRRVRAHIPETITPGVYSLSLTDLTLTDFASDQVSQGTASKRTHALIEVAIMPSTRLFVLPALSRPVDAALLDSDSSTVTVTLRGLLDEPAARADDPERPAASSGPHATADISSGPHATADILAVNLVWETHLASLGNYHAFVHLVDEAGRIITQSDKVPAPRGNAGKPTSQWLAGEIILDEHDLVLPPELAPGAYLLLAGLYEPISGERLLAVNAAGELYADGAIPLMQVEWPNLIDP